MAKSDSGRSVVLKYNDGKWLKVGRASMVESVELTYGRTKFDLPMKDVSMLAEYFRKKNAEK